MHAHAASRAQHGMQKGCSWQLAARVSSTALHVHKLPCLRVADVGGTSHAGHAKGKARRVHSSPQEPSQRCTPCKKTAPGPALIPHCILFEQEAAQKSVAYAGHAERHVQSEEDHAPLGHPDT